MTRATTTGINVRFEENVFWFEITVDQSCFLEHGHGVQQLGGEHLDELCAETLELILFDELIEVGREQLEDETKVVAVNERVEQSEDMMFVLRITLIVQLKACQTGPERHDEMDVRAPGW